MNEVVEYIVKFLLNGNEHLSSRVGYTREQSKFERYDVVIVPSSFFDADVYGTEKSLPKLPLSQIDDTPVLYGEPRIERIGDTLVVYADIVASTFFLISRYEEWLHPNDYRDVHGRFIGKKSLPYLAHFINKPVVDNYAKCLRRWLKQAGCEVVEPKQEFSQIYLTHDVDVLTHYRCFRSFCGGLLHNCTNFAELKHQFRAIRDIESDPIFTFRWLMEQDSKLTNARKIYFLKSPIKTVKNDLPKYNLNGCDCQYLLRLLQSGNCEVGLHASYYSGGHIEQLIDEKQKLESSLNIHISANRWHYLRTLSPNDFQKLVDSGVEHDFTMGYADVAGFRLGTSRAVRWINPQTQQLTSLMLHPLLVMDCTLSDERYMNLDEHAAQNYVTDLLEQVKRNNGEVVLLWHNSIFCEDNYHKQLYSKILDYLAQ